jgi:hypothetical protein
VKEREDQDDECEYEEPTYVPTSLRHKKTLTKSTNDTGATWSPIPNVAKLSGMGF